MTTKPEPKWKQYLKNASRKPEYTSTRVGSLAAGILNDPKSTPAQKSVAGSALTQRPDRVKVKLSREAIAKSIEGLKAPNSK